MKFYRILVRLGGSLLNEVWKPRVSAPEVMILNAIHGGNGVVEIHPANIEPEEKDYSPKQHRHLRLRLEQTYGAKAAHMEIINSLFGSAKSGLLPTEVSLADLAPEQVDMLDDEPETELPKPVAQETPEDPKDALKQSLKDLDWPVPSGNVSEKRLREELKLAQEAWAEKNNPEEDASGVLAG